MIRTCKMVLASVLPIITCIALAACAAVAQDEPIVIRFWDGPRPSSAENKFEWAEAAAQKFEREHPNVKIELTRMSWQEIVVRVDEALLTGDWPDIVSLSLGNGGISPDHAAAGLIERTDDYWEDDDLNDLFPAAQAAFSLDGGFYGFPLSISTYCLLLNARMFSERGVALPESGKWTLDEFVRAARSLSVAGEEIYGFSGCVNKGYYDLWPFFYSAGVRPLTENNSRFGLDTPQALSVLTQLVELKFVHDAACPKTGSSDRAGVWHCFVRADAPSVAIQPWPDWALSLALADRDSDVDPVVASFPSFEAHNPVSIAATYGFSVLAQNDAQKRRLCFEFADSLTSIEQQRHFAETSGWLPARRSATTDTTFPHPEYERLVSFLDDAVPLPVHPKWIQIESRINAQIQFALLGEKTPQKALNDARYEVESLLGER